MTLGQMRALCKLYLNVNASQLNDDITDAQWNAFIQQAYNDVWMRVRTQVSRATLLSSTDLTWPAGQQTMTLPTNLQNALIYDIWRIDGNGNPLCQFQAFFETRNVLRNPTIFFNAAGWQIRLYFVPEIEQLTNDEAIPNLIPPQYHSVLVWETLLVVKALYDKEIPASWEKKRDEVDFSLIKEQSTRPVAQRSNIMLAQSPMARPLAGSSY